MENLNKSQKVMVAGMVLSIISLFFAWADLGIVKASGFQQQGYIFLVVFIYPLIKIIKNKSVSKVGGYVCGGLGLVLGILYIIGSNQDFFGTTVNTSGTGIYVFMLSCIVFMVGVHMQMKESDVTEEK